MHLASADVTARSVTNVTGGQTAEPLSILIVDDEVLIAMLMEDALHLLGCNVVGPAGAVAPAMKLIEADDQMIDGAFLDVNLRGEFIYPVADALLSRHVPFAFVTGYSKNQIDARYASVPALTKPVEIESIDSFLRLFGDRRRANDGGTG